MAFNSSSSRPDLASHEEIPPNVSPRVLKPKSIGDLLFDDGVDLEKSEACLKGFGAKQLRTECYLRQLCVIKKGPDCNDNKLGYVSLILAQKRVFAGMQRLGVGTGPAKPQAAGGAKRRSRHCMIRLMNIIFSERFANRWRELNAQPTRAELDTNQTQGNSSIWSEVHAEFLSSREEYGKLASDLHAFRKCDPIIVVPHEPAKLQDMWKDVLSRYNTSLSNSRVSGMHDNDFFSYCSGKIEVLYLHKWMKIKPGLANAVEGKIPKQARLDTFGASDPDEDSAPEEHHYAKRACKGKSRRSVDAADIFAFLQEDRAATESLELDCHLAQLVTTLSALMSLRERMMSAPPGIYSVDDLQDVIDDIAPVRAKKKAILRK